MAEESPKVATPRFSLTAKEQSGIEVERLGRVFYSLLQCFAGNHRLEHFFGEAELQLPQVGR